MAFARASLLFIPILSFVQLTLAGEIPGLGVKEAALSRGIDGQKNFIKPAIDPKNTTIKEGPIYLWTVLSGTQETLEALRGEKFWPIRHIWTYRGPVGEASPEDVGREREPEPLMIGPIKHRTALQEETRGPEGLFD